MESDSKVNVGSLCRIATDTMMMTYNIIISVLAFGLVFGRILQHAVSTSVYLVLSSARLCHPSLVLLSIVSPVLL